MCNSLHVQQIEVNIAKDRVEKMTLVLTSLASTCVNG